MMAVGEGRRVASDAHEQRLPEPRSCRIGEGYRAPPGPPEGVLIQSRHLRGLSKGKPAIGVKAAGQLNLHVPLEFARTEWQAGQRLLVKIKNDAHAESVALSGDGVKESTASLQMAP